MRPGLRRPDTTRASAAAGLREGNADPDGNRNRASAGSLRRAPPAARPSARGDDSGPCLPPAGFSLSRALDRQAFQFPEDAFAFPNETLWSYARDPVSGRQVHLKRSPPPEYHLRCFVMARSAKQFFAHARFDPGAAPPPPESRAQSIATVVSRDPRQTSRWEDRIVFPGYPSLRAFSAANADLCRAGLGGAWQSYLQRGHWRMILPWTRRGQRAEALRLAAAVRANRAPVIHVFTFPALTINHAVVAYAVETTTTGLRFATYDPNAPNAPLPMDFEQGPGEFRLPPTVYFIGGRVDAYEVYCGLLR